METVLENVDSFLFDIVFCSFCSVVYEYDVSDICWELYDVRHIVLELAYALYV
jgi:hypothetical protein